MKDVTKEILIRLGVDPSYKGFKHLGEAIELVVAESNMKADYLYHKLTSPGTSWQRVERNIRKAIENAFDNNASELYEIFQYTIKASRGKATNKQFIAMIAEVYGSRIRSGI